MKLGIVILILASMLSSGAGSGDVKAQNVKVLQNRYDETQYVDVDDVKTSDKLIFLDEASADNAEAVSGTAITGSAITGVLVGKAPETPVEDKKEADKSDTSDDKKDKKTVASEKKSKSDTDKSDKKNNSRDDDKKRSSEEKTVAKLAKKSVKKTPAKKTRKKQIKGRASSSLTKGKGVFYGPSGKETYYNLDMSGVVKMMKWKGIDKKYWVREDGVKMYGDYVMCAANLDVHPRGSLVETSLGTAMVCDTGGFASSNPHALDIATNW